MPVTAQDTLDGRLAAHLGRWLGSWPPTSTLEVVSAPQRQTPGWDGRLHPAIGVADAHGRAVLSVPPGAADTVRRYRDRYGSGTVLSSLPVLLGLPGRSTYRAVFRWTTRPAPLADTGRWVPADDPEVPGWLRPFGGRVLIATSDDGRHLGGVGVKRHDEHANELSVVVAPAERGHGLGTALIAQAARRVLAEGRIPTYLHGVDNPGSARLAHAAGFPDHGWTSFGISEAPTTHPPLTVYGTSWCPDVRRSRAVLDHAGVPYAYVDLDHDTAASRVVRRLQRGKRRIPTLVWPDGEHLVEPTDHELRTRLATTAHHTDTDTDTDIEPDIEPDTEPATESDIERSA